MDKFYLAASLITESKVSDPRIPMFGGQTMNLTDRERGIIGVMPVFARREDALEWVDGDERKIYTITGKLPDGL